MFDPKGPQRHCRVKWRKPLRRFDDDDEEMIALSAGATVEEEKA